jgi:cytochrome d ubiquinol oxidase subunit I
MSAVMLARIQFGFTIGYHFFYVPISMGLALLMVIAETRYARSGSDADRAASDFWIRLLAITFAIGVGSGIVMEFAFGTNWANYVRFVGDVFGPPLAAEGITSFFLESTFLAVLLFGRRRVSKRLYRVSTWLVFAGATLSALWILIANSWQQTPAGFRVEGGRAILTDFFAAAANPSIGPRFLHTVTATWLTGAFIAIGVSAYYLLKRRHLDFARRWMGTALTIAAIASVAMLLLGHLQALVVTKHQPIKLAAMEARFTTGDHAELYAFGWVDPAKKTAYGIAIPDGLSLLVGFKSSAVIAGLDQAPSSDWPPLQLVFQAWHLMVALGLLLIAASVLLLALNRKGRLERMRWLLVLMIALSIVPTVAIYAGWITAEVGRQPWVVQGYLRTADAASGAVSASQIATSLGAFAVVYGLLLVAWGRLTWRTVRRGPVEEVAAAYGEPASVGKGD